MLFHPNFTCSFIFWSTLSPFSATSMCMHVGPSRTTSCLVFQGLHWRKLTLLSQKSPTVGSSSVRAVWAPLPSMWTFHMDGLSVGLVGLWPLSSHVQLTCHVRKIPLHWTHALFCPLQSVTISSMLSPEPWEEGLWYRCPLRTEHSAISFSLNINCNWWLLGSHHLAPK